MTQIQIKIKSTTPSKWCPWHYPLSIQNQSRREHNKYRGKTESEPVSGSNFNIDKTLAPSMHVPDPEARDIVHLSLKTDPIQVLTVSTRVVNTGVSLFFFPALTDRLNTASKYLILPVKWVFSSQIQI